MQHTIPIIGIANAGIKEQKPPQEVLMNSEARKVVVVGGSRGIGKAICVEFANAGFDVAIIYHSNDAAAESVKEEVESAGRRACIVKADMSDYAQNKDAIVNAAGFLGGIDVLVNSAGIFPKQALEEITVESWNKVINTNLNSCFYSIQNAIPYLKESKHGGRIINMSSQAALTGSVNGTAYCASKAGILGLTYALAKELGSAGITINAVVPGRIATEMIDYASAERKNEWLRETPLGRFGTPEEVAKAVLFLASDASSYVTGAKLNICGGLIMG